MSERGVTPARLRRLAEELTEELAGYAVALDGPEEWRDLLLVELDYALRPAVHERRVPSFGSILDPKAEPPEWDAATELRITRRALGEMPLGGARRFADGLSSWLLRRPGRENELTVFDRPAGSERDLVVLAESLRGTLVQRHPSGTVRAVGAFGVLRSDGTGWHHEPPISTWIDSLSACPAHGDPHVLERLFEFAVHDLGARGIGAILVYRPDDDEVASLERRLPTPPPLHILRPSDLAPLRHVLAQVDGAAVFDRAGALRDLGVRLVPSPGAEAGVSGYRGMRHTSGRRYSFDDGRATVIVVSEDGPVTVLRKGELLGASPRDAG